ncbi:hypothetical protein QQZ08_011224 [Neonectria magnoliae]|uniref:Uncharacterized protein n=1 Tax=Neonectria magnoliae TaxID=2732573 RepID=A0ABR1HBS5_9HYPO
MQLHWWTNSDVDRNGKHCWTMLFLGEANFSTFSGNWVHDMSGRAPHMGTDATESEIVFHAVNNYFQDVDGHAFNIDTNVAAAARSYSVVTVDNASGCSGEFPSLTSSAVLSKLAPYKDSLIDHISVAEVPASVVKNAGVGHV